MSENTTTINKILSEVRSPMIFNALAIILVALLVWRTASIQPTPALVWVGLAFIAAVTIWLNVFAAIRPRFLAYGPKEYIRESEMAHELRMAQIGKAPNH